MNVIPHFNKRYNTYDLSGEYGIGYTRKGEPFYFDLEDYDLIKEYCWSISGSTKTVCASGGVTKGNKHIALHRLVMGVADAGKDVQVDHIYHKRYDNRKSQLRICNNSQNSFNKSAQSNNTSGCPGVSWDKKDKVWHAYIQKDGKRINKYFHSYDEATSWRKNMEEQIFKEFRYQGDENNNE